jgi:hypothetical protein
MQVHITDHNYAIEKFDFCFQFKDSKIIKYFDLWWQVVHNYGHGGYGVTAAPGTSKHAIKLMQELHLCTYGQSKL